MSEVFFQELSIPSPDYNLKIGSNTQGKQTGEMIAAIEQVLFKERPDLVLVYGDTNSTLAGALAASKLNIKIAHVEAGLRSFDRQMPEEINRVITDHVSNILFAPTERAATNLRSEGIVDGVHVVGDVMVDSILSNLEIARKRSTIVQGLKLKDKEYLVATIHRQSNTDNVENLMNIINTLGRSKATIVFPAHPRTKNTLQSNGLWEKMPENIVVTEPLGYLDMLRLMSSAEKMITDSGGIQKEAYIMRVPCITVRNTTEWTETVEDGWNVLVGTDMKKLADNIEHFRPTGSINNKYGSGDAGEKIAEVLDHLA